MRWAALFADLEAQAGALDNAARAAEIEDRARVEVGRIRLLDRLRPAVGMPLRLRCAAGGAAVIAGRLEQAGAEWLLVDEGAGREALVVVAGILSVSGLGRLSAAPDTEGVVESRLGLRHALRVIARDRSVVRVLVADGSIFDGTLDRIGADFIEVAEHPPGELRRRNEVRDVLVVPLTAVVVVQREA